jgi:GAF domain-containing protein
MHTPDHPANELIRLTTLQSLHILDTPPEERFDRITRIAQRLFNVPIALVSLIDSERQWFKSCQGLEVCETPRNISFCGHAILDNALFVVPDTLLDDRFRDNPLVTGGPKIRFYAGAPLSLGNGVILGTLCVIDRVPRHLTDEDQQLLVDLGQIAQQELLAMQLSTLDELKQRNVEMKLLSEISDFLQACLTVEEACDSISSLIAQLFPGCSGAIFTLSNGFDRVEHQAHWGGPLSSQSEFDLQDCWGLRRGCAHWLQGANRPHCNHMLPDQTVAALCVPMMARGETLGLFYLSTPNAQALTEAKRQLARTVAEQVAMAIVNLNLRKPLRLHSSCDRLTKA